MKILFVDGKLSYFKHLEEIYKVVNKDDCLYKIDAKYGYAYSIENIQNAINRYYDAVYTNCLWLCDNKYCWNKETNSPDIYFWVKDKFVKFTDFYPNIKEVNSIEKMYKANVFEECLK